MSLNKIPKVIHYCWFSGEEVPEFLQSCISSWKEVMPDYELRLWNANSFDFNSIPFVKEAFKLRKWAFVADYIRLYALFTEGGIYMDSDVRVFKRFDEFLKYDFFTSHELHPSQFTASEKNKLDSNYLPVNKQDYVYGLNVQAAIMGGAKGNAYIKECMDFYNDKHLVSNDGRVLDKEFVIGPYISKTAEKYGYVYNDNEQHLADNMIILKPEVFVGNHVFLTKNSYAIHLMNGSWREKTLYESVHYKIKNNYPRLFVFVLFCEDSLRKIKKGISSK